MSTGISLLPDPTSLPDSHMRETSGLRTGYECTSPLLSLP